MTARVKLLASVHIAKKDMAWDDDTYRDILRRHTGCYSAGDCSDAQLQKVLTEFRKLGWGAKRKLSSKPHVRMIYAIWGDIRKMLKGASGDSELRAFVRRQTKSQLHPQGVSAPEFLEGQDATNVIEGLKGWRARLRAPKQESAT